MKKLVLLLEMLKMVVLQPRKVLKHLTIENLKTLFYALKYEKSEDINNNFNKLVKENFVKQQPHSISVENNKSQMPTYIINHNHKLKDFKGEEKIDFNSLKKVVIIGDLNLVQCKKYRVLQKLEIFNRIGIASDFSHWKDVPRCLRIMQDATSVIFYRLPYNDYTVSYYDEAIRLKLTIGYDIDDPIFDYNIYENNKNLDYISKSEKAGLLKSTRDYTVLMRQCDFVIGSTPRMVELIESHTKRPVFLLRNLMDSETLNAVNYVEQTYIEEKKDTQIFTIVYMSGSRAHEGDFNVVIEALDNILRAFSNVNLRVVGYAELTKNLINKYPNQVNHKEFTDYYHYIGAYQNADLNIIPLLQDEFNDCKSGIRLCEAALLNVPTMVSSTGDFINIIENNKTGIIVDNTSDRWEEKLTFYIKNRELLKEIGVNAKKLVNNKYTIHNYTNYVNKELLKIL